MHCKCCDAMLPPVTVYRAVLIPHPTEQGKTTTMRIEDDFCNKCATKSNPYYVTEEAEDLTQLGIHIPQGNYNDHY